MELELSKMIPSVDSNITEKLGAKVSPLPKIPSIGIGGGTIIDKILIIVLAILIIIISSSGYYVKKYSKEESIGINSSMIQFFMGFGTGLIFYIVFNLLKILSTPNIIILGLFLSVIGEAYMLIFTLK